MSKTEVAILQAFGAAEEFLPYKAEGLFITDIFFFIRRYSLLSHAPLLSELIQEATRMVNKGLLDTMYSKRVEGGEELMYFISEKGKNVLEGLDSYSDSFYITKAVTDVRRSLRKA